MPYDLYLYFVGRWARLVSDSGNSYFLFLNIKKKMDTNEADQLLEKIQYHLKNKSIKSEETKTESWEIELIELGYTQGQTSPEKIKSLMLAKPQDALYTDPELLKPSTLSNPPLVAGCHITGTRSYSLEDYVFSTAESAANSHDKRNPLIISINLYQETDMSEYMNGPRISRRYYAWCKEFFSKYQHVAMLLISSNYDRYKEVDDNLFALGTKYLVVESQHWENVLAKFN